MRLLRWLVAALFLVFLGFAGAYGLIVAFTDGPDTVHLPTAADQQTCINNAYLWGRRLETYAELRDGALPPSLKSLSDIAPSEFVQSLRCPFDRRPPGEGHQSSYTYVPPHRHVVDADGRRVLLYCNAPHPHQVKSAAGPLLPGLVPVVYDDFSVRAIPREEFHIRAGKDE